MIALKEEFFICDNCGVKCNPGDTYCKKCHYTFPKVEEEPVVIEGIENEELSNYIDWHSEYYVNKFKKTKKNWFIGINLSALIFGPTWYFFRKMYKMGIIYTLITALLPCLLLLTFCAISRDDIIEYFEIKETRSEFYDKYDFDEYYFEDSEHHYEYEQITNEFMQANEKIKLINILSNVPGITIDILFRLFANAFYKNHIISNIEKKNGGTSIKWAIWHVVLRNVGTTILSALLGLTLIVVIFGNIADGISALI